jgi:hypothetical protein
LLDTIIAEAERVAETADLTSSKIQEMVGETNVNVGAPEVAPRFMTCPWCGETGQWLNVGSSHWGTCAECEVKWPIGSNLLPSWQAETEDDWKRNAELLARYEEAE